MNLQQYRGLWLPADETHLIEWMEANPHFVEGVQTYQYQKLERAMRYVRQFSVALDVGAHCGLWAMHLARMFGRVHCFEPVMDYIRCLQRNLNGEGDVHVHAFALGDENGNCSVVRAENNSGNTCIRRGPGEVCQIKRYDDLGLMQRVDFVKIDTEGFELFVLRGMVETLKRWRPTLIVEQKPDQHISGAWKYGLGETDAVRFLEGMGATVRDVIAGDYILTW